MLTLLIRGLDSRAGSTRDSPSVYLVGESRVRLPEWPVLPTKSSITLRANNRRIITRACARGYTLQTSRKFASTPPACFNQTVERRVHQAKHSVHMAGSAVR